MTHVMTNDTFNAISFQSGGISYKKVPVSALKIEKIGSIDFFKSKNLDFSSLQPGVKLNNLVIYKSKESPINAWKSYHFMITFSPFIFLLLLSLSNYQILFKK